MNIVISQPMLFPWPGLLEQIVLADRFVNYADVQFSKGSFSNRVQIKTAQGSRWLTVPLEKFHFGARIDEVRPSAAEPWRERHLAMLEQAYQEAPFRQEMLDLAHAVYAADYHDLGTLALASMEALCNYLSIPLRPKLLDSRSLGIPGRNSDRVLAIVGHLHGTRYITGHGAKNYLAHEEFEQHGVAVEYMNYAMQPYPQLHGTFTPFVSSLDLIANHGAAGRRFLKPQTIAWREFIHERN
jgi:hypothetical protein